MLVSGSDSLRSWLRLPDASLRPALWEPALSGDAQRVGVNKLYQNRKAQ